MFNRIEFVLIEKNVTKAALAKVLGIDGSTVGRWCANYTQPPLDALYVISKFLGVSMESLQYIVPKPFRVKKELNLSLLNVNDAILYTVQGKSTLLNFQHTYFQINTVYENGMKMSYPLDLTGFVSTKQNPKIPLIEVIEVIENCKFSKLTVENCSEELIITFLCQPTDK